LESHGGAILIRRALAVGLLSGGYLAWGLVSGTHGGPAASALTASGAALAATSSQCEPLPVAATPSPTASTGLQADLCVSVQTSESSITRGQAASYTVQVWAANGSASGVSVTLTAVPQGEEPEFTGRCPSGDGSATCTIGALATALAPSTYQMQAQIPIASGATSVTWVTLTATADAATSPVMTALPDAAGTVTVSAPTAAASTPPASQSPASTPSPAASPATVPAAAATPTTGPTTASPAGASTSLVSPAGAGGAITTSAAPAAGTSPSPAAGTATPSSGGFTVVIPTTAAEILGSIVLALMLLFAGTRLGHRVAARRAQGEEQDEEGIVTRRRRFWPWRPPGRWRAASRRGSQDAAAGAPAGDTARLPQAGHVAARSGAGPAAEDQS